MKPAGMVLIWSNQKRMWWRANAAGYTPIIDDAGRYTRTEAQEIVNKSTCQGELTHTHINPTTGEVKQLLDEVIVEVPSAFGTGDVLTKIALERHRQDRLWGEQNHPDGTGGPGTDRDARVVRVMRQRAAEAGAVTWRHILDEEVAEAFAAGDETELHTELVQVAAVAAAWAEAIDRRYRNERSA